MHMTPIVDEVHRALAADALEASAISVLSPPSVRKRGRATFRIEIVGREPVKARWLESSDEARRLFEVRAGLESAFAPAIAAHGRVLLEKWVVGEPVADRGESGALDEIARHAGALLARLHARPVSSDGTRAHPNPPIRTDDWSRDAQADIERLVQVGKLGSREAKRLRATLHDTDPRWTETVLTHRDFCGENMVIDDQRQLRVIDNEWFAPAPAGFDLGRTHCRWPMGTSAWVGFVSAYAAVTAMDPRTLVYWRIVAALWSARIRLETGRLEAPLAVLRTLVHERDSLAPDPIPTEGPLVPARRVP